MRNGLGSTFVVGAAAAFAFLMPPGHAAAAVLADEDFDYPTPGDLAKGVYESLVNTTIGLFISIVFLSAYFFMKNKISDICLRVNNSIGEILSRNLSPEAQKEQGGAR